MKLKMLLAGAAVVCASPVCTAETHRLDASEGQHTYAVREPVLRIQPGDIIESATLYSDFFTAKDGPWPGEVGPVYVNGATPGDTLVVRILAIRPNLSTGRSGTSKVYGSRPRLTSLFSSIS